MAGGSHKYEIRFVTEIDDILRKMQELVSKIGQMRGQLVVDIVGPDGRPVSQLFGGGNGGGQSQGLNVSSSAGTSMRGTPGAIDLRDPSTGHVVASGVRSDPYDGRSTYQGFRQDDPALGLIMAQRSVREREQHIALLTGGQTAGEYVGGRIRGLQGAQDPESQATLAALRNFKNTLDETSKVLAKLRREREEAIQGGDVRKAADVQKEIEERTRIKESMVQGITGGGGGGGGGFFGPAMEGMINKAIAGITLAAAVKFFQKFGDAASSAPVTAEQSLGSAGDLNKRLIHAATTFNSESLLTLSPGAIQNAEMAAYMGGGKPTMHPLSTLSSLFFGGSPYLKSETSAANAYFDAKLKSQGGLKEITDMSLERLGNRRGITDTYGMTQRRQYLSRGIAIPTTLESGFTESDVLGAMQTGIGSGLGQGQGGFYNLGGLFRSGVNGMGLGTAARGTGLDLSTLTGLTGSMKGAGIDDVSARNDMIRILEKGVEGGVRGAGLVKLTEELVQTVQTGAGGGVTSGALNNMLPFMNAGLHVGGPAMGGAIGADASQRLQAMGNATGGFQGVLNWANAERTIRKFHPGADESAVQLATALLSGYDPSQWDSPEAKSMLDRIFAGHEHGVMNPGSMTKQQQMKLFGIPDATLGRVGTQGMLGLRRQVLGATYGMGSGDYDILEGLQRTSSSLQGNALAGRTLNEGGGMDLNEFLKQNNLPGATADSAGNFAIAANAAQNMLNPITRGTAAADTSAATLVNTAVPMINSMVDAFQRIGPVVTGLGTAARDAANNLLRVASQADLTAGAVGSISRVSPPSAGTATKSN